MKKKSKASKPADGGFDWSTVVPIKPGELVVVPVAKHVLIEASAFASWQGESPIAQILSGAVEIAKQRGFFFFTHREIGDQLTTWTGQLAYSLGLGIIAAAGRDRAFSLCATLLQTTGAILVLRQPEAAHTPQRRRDAQDVLKLLLGL